MLSVPLRRRSTEPASARGAQADLSNAISRVGRASVRAPGAARVWASEQRAHVGRSPRRSPAARPPRAPRPSEASLGRVDRSGGREGCSGHQVCCAVTFVRRDRVRDRRFVVAARGFRLESRPNLWIGARPKFAHTALSKATHTSPWRTRPAASALRTPARARPGPARCVPATRHARSDASPRARARRVEAQQSPSGAVRAHGHLCARSATPRARACTAWAAGRARRCRARALAPPPPRPWPLPRAGPTPRQAPAPRCPHQTRLPRRRRAELCSLSLRRPWRSPHPSPAPLMAFEQAAGKDNSCVAFLVAAAAHAASELTVAERSVEGALLHATTTTAGTSGGFVQICSAQPRHVTFTRP